jgi:hypothetical protein
LKRVGRLPVLVGIGFALGGALSVSALAQTPDATPPTVVCDSADGAWHGGDVAVSCVASDSESGLADPADASFFLTTSVPAGTETTSAETDSRMVCDAAGNCATAGPVGGTMIDRKAPRNPTTSSSHRLRRWSRDRTIRMALFGASDGGSGVSGYSITWTRSATTAPDRVRDIGAAGAVTSRRLVNGRWYFHLRTRDNVGNWSAAIHRGPFFIDGTAPRVRALFSRGRVNRVIRLRYRLSDFSGRTRERVTVHRSGRLVKTIRTRMQRAFSGVTYSVGYRPNRAGAYRFCVRAWDPAGNRSRRDCAGLRVRGNPPPSQPNCHPSYQGQCLNPNVSDYDCAGGGGNGPGYVYGTVTVVGPDEYGLDADGDGIGCE